MKNKKVGFLHHGNEGVKAIIEKNLLGCWCMNGCSMYLWGHALDS